MLAPLMPPALCLIDLDGTLRAGRTLTHLAARFDVEKQVARILDAGLGPHASHLESERVMACFAGVPAAQFAAACAEPPCRPGARRFVADLQDRGFRVGIVTASYEPAATAAQAATGADHVVAVVPEVQDGRLTGRLAPTTWDGPCGRMVCKETVLTHLRDRTGADFTLAIGNADNDICMFQAADMSVAIEPISKLAEAAADTTVATLGDILPLLDRRHPDTTPDQEPGTAETCLP